MARAASLWHNRLALAGALMLAMVIFAAVFAQVLSPFDPLEMNPPHLLEPPGASHWLGTDEFGRDILGRVIWGARISLYVGGIAVTIALVAGLSLGRCPVTMAACSTMSSRVSWT